MAFFGKLKKTPKRIRRLNYLIALCAAIMIVSGVMFVKELIEYKAGSDVYDALDDLVQMPSAPAVITSAPPVSPTPDQAQPTEIPSETISETPLPEETDESGEPPEESGPEPSYTDNLAPEGWPVVDFAGLAAINGDSTAWLIGAGTNINYPVVHRQSSDGNTHYLEHVFNGNKNKAGTLFVDMRNNSGFTDRNTIIYGHNMRNHSMFWTVTRYKNQAYYNQHPTLKLMTPGGNYEIQLFAGYVSNTNEKDQEAWRIGFGSSANFLKWVAASKERSSFTTNVDVTADDRVVTLSTCSYEFNGARYIIVGKLVPQ